MTKIYTLNSSYRYYCGIVKHNLERERERKRVKRQGEWERTKQANFLSAFVSINTNWQYKIVIRKKFLIPAHYHNQNKIEWEIFRGLKKDIVFEAGYGNFFHTPDNSIGTKNVIQQNIAKWQTKRTHKIKILNVIQIGCIHKNTFTKPFADRMRWLRSDSSKAYCFNPREH